jgi:DNA-binding phage protein
VTIKTDEYLTLAKVAEETGVARTSLYTHIQKGNLKAKKLDFFTVVTPADAAAFKKRLKRVKIGNRTIIVFQ